MPGQSSAQLARAASVTPQTMASLLAKLEEKQLIVRVVSTVHAKVLVTRPNPACEPLGPRADEGAREVEQSLADEFTEAEHAQLRGLLTRATRVLRGTDAQ